MVGTGLGCSLEHVLPFVLGQSDRRAFPQNLKLAIVRLDSEVRDCRILLVDPWVRVSASFRQESEFL